MTSGVLMPRASMSDIEEITSLAGADLLALRGARIFITGGTGYIGRWLLESLCHANRIMNLQLNVTVLSRKPTEFANRYPHLTDDPAITLIAGDVRHFSCSQDGFSHIIHAATDVVTSTAPLDLFDVTVMGTRHVLEFARRQGVRDVLLLSSGAVYGSFHDGIERASESLPCSIDEMTARSAYGLGKIATEWLGNTYGQEYGFSCKSARVFAQIGPYLELGAQFAAGNFIRDALSGESIVIKGDGTPLRSYMYATDLVAWLWAILVRGQAGQAYNVGSDQGISISELAQTIVRTAGVEGVDIKILGQSAPGAAPARYIPDTALVRDKLGLSITVPLEDALKRTIEWHRAQIRESQK
ncbi:NAD-dependent epimerase/dehydratase family protein [Herbaspirillum seropedicae]|uniref:NAD-dependent epimerase/dehydratase family protein n=1 Tax=Herbaspirillum seropedicae TaxID=964 RepID=UPI003FCE8456